MITKLILINVFLLGPYLYNNLIFLEIPQKIEQYQIDFNLNKEDVRYVRYYFLNNKYPDLTNLPKVPTRANVDNFFKILKNQKNQNWTKAYLYLLTIVPELFIEDEIGC